MSKKDISEKDKALFRAHMRDVTPLAKKGLKKPAIRQTAKQKPPAEIIPSPPPLSSFIAEPVHAETTLAWQRYPLPSKRLKHLKQGKIAPEAQLDLHGMHAEDASIALWQFIQKEKNRGNRCIRIIHGKGSLKGEAPVLKNLVNLWLKQMDDILAFHSCIPAHGGSGAVYVLLKH